MTPSIDLVLTAALELTDSERLELVEALIASFESPDRLPFDETWRQVIRRRSAELASGVAVPVPWAEVKRRAREAAGG